ncbi:MAG: glycosyltransferase family 4 protein [Ardenticatenales bacterium]|nr:glycosyltransferase family 4 protein [Ardenticatenales bacterium]
MRLAIVTAAFHASDDDPFVPVWRDMVHALGVRADVVVFPLRLPAAGPPYTLDGARVVPLGHGMVRLRRSPAMWRSAVRAVVTDHSRRPFDAVLALQAGEPGFVAALIALRIGRPLQVHVAGGELVCHPALGYGSRCRWVERAQVRVALRRAAVVTTGCDAMAQRARSSVPAGRARRVRLAPLGIEPRTWGSIEPRVLPERFAARGTPVPRLLSVADLRPIKDHRLLIHAFARVAAQQPVTLDIVGAGETLAETRIIGRHLGVADRIRYWGRVPPGVRHIPFAQAHAFVHTSRHEAQGMALIEAAMLGLPIATTRVGVAESLPEGGRTLADVGDEDGLVRAIQRALDGATAPLARRAMGRAAVSATYDRDHCAARWIDLLAAASGRPCAVEQDEP